MRKAKRNIGREILEGIVELKRGKTGRVTQISDEVRFVGSHDRPGDVVPSTKRAVRSRIGRK